MSDAALIFREFFREIQKRPPFPWQEALVEEVCAQGWPDVIALPTGSGKTVCVDIAVFALARGCKAARRRVFYVVDRRLVVNEAYLRMQAICKALQERKTPAVRAVADALSALAHAGSEAPLVATALLGGAYRDEGWARTPLQPAVVASTVDQVGSRLLFRGYGISPYSASIHAGLIANDSLILLDEAHASRAFAETLAHVERYRGRAAEEISCPLRFVEMTATPSRTSGSRFCLSDGDRADKELGRRLRAPKPAELVLEGGKRDDWDGLATKLVAKAEALAKGAGARRVAIMCNRVRVARSAYEVLKKSGKRVALAIGRMRPLDREDLYDTRLRHLKSGVAREPDAEVEYVVATQTLEVGADLDFDVLVTEIASLDAVLQRFGRLNRMGQFPAARGAIVAAKWQLDGKRPPDAVYGKAIAATWEWLSRQAEGGRLEMGIEEAAGTTVPQAAAALSDEERFGLCRLGPRAPILLPAHLDTLAQTSPRPDPEPEVGLFLHGEAGGAESYVVWRGDLVGRARNEWAEMLAFCPPLAAEALPVKTWELRRWLAGGEPEGDHDADVEGVTEAEGEETTNGKLQGVIWRGGKAVEQRELELRPGDYLVLAADTKPPDRLGWIPPDERRDLGDLAQCRMRRRFTLRLDKGTIRFSPEGAERGAALARLDGDEWTHRTVTAVCEDFARRWASGDAETLRRVTFDDDREEGGVARITAKFQYGGGNGGGAVTLKRHLEDVAVSARAIACRALGDSGVTSAVVEAARRHDWGKVDRRFQAWLRGGGMAGRFNPILLAKSEGGLGRQVAAGLPEGFRHELLSLQLADAEMTDGAAERDLVLHLIASHHGRCRPFAPVVGDDDPPAAHFNGCELGAEARRERPAHRLDGGVAERYWSLTARFGWWGLAYLETMLRLADWEASAREASEVEDE